MRGANNGIYEEVPDTTLPVQTTKALSIGGQEMNTQQLRYVPLPLDNLFTLLFSV